MSSAHDDNDDRYEVNYHDGEEFPIVSPQPKLPALLISLGLDRVTAKDKITVKYQNGAIKAVVKRANGSTETVHRNVSAGFDTISRYNPDTCMSKDHRNDEIRARRRAGATQAAIAEQFGLSQSMVARILSEK